MKFSKYRVDPAELGLARATIEDLRGGDARFNADAIRQVIGGEPSPHRDIAVLNVAAALMVIGRAPDLPTGITMACEVIDDGRADAVLEALIRVSQLAAPGRSRFRLTPPGPGHRGGSSAGQDEADHRVRPPNRNR